MTPFDFNPFGRRNLPKKISEQEEKKLSEKNWVKCPSCGVLIYDKQLKDNMNICPKCEYLFRLNSTDRIKLIFDENTFEEKFNDIEPKDVLNFSDRIPYSQRLKEAKNKTGLKEAIRVGTGSINNIKVATGIMDFGFIGGSMGVVVGEKIVRIVEFATQEKLPLTIFSSSGGARMQEGMYSLVQMARTAAVIGRYQKAGGFYISVLTHPTTGGVSASFAFLGDVIIAEPGALIGFAGPRVIEQTTKQKLPSGFQTSEFLLEHGQIDKIVKRKQLKQCINTLFGFYEKGKQT